MSRERPCSWLDRNGPLLAIAIAVLGGLVGIFDRSLSFHDEIINTGKANEGVILDYAMRPVFYGLNIVARHVFGNHSYSLVILSVITLAITALCLYQICARYFNPTTGLLCVIAYAGVNMVRVYGVRAMAHTHAGMFMILSLYAALLCFETQEPRRQRVLGLLAGFLAIVSFSTHPTMAGYLVSLCSWAAFTWFLGLSSRKPRAVSVKPLARPMRPTLWMAIGVIGSILGLVVIYALFYYQGYFTAWFGFAKIPQGLESEKELSLFYVKSLLWKGGVATLFLLGSMIILFLGRNIRNTSDSKKSRDRGMILAMPLYCLVVGMALISLNQWKHERIVFSYVPLLVLAFACWTTAAMEVLASRFSVLRFQRLLGACVVVVGMAASRRIYLMAESDSHHALAQRFKYLSLYETLRNVPDRKIGVLAGPGPLGTKMSFASAASLLYERISSTDKLATLSKDQLRSAIMSKEVRYLYWDLESTSKQEYAAISRNLYAIGGQHLTNWRGLREVWVVNFDMRGSFGRSLAKLASGTRIAIFGEPTELSKKTGFSIHLLLEHYQLRPYILNVNKRSARRELHYITRNEADYVLMPVKADNSVSREEILAMEQALTQVGAVLLERDQIPELQVWNIPNRKRAAAYAE